MEASQPRNVLTPKFKIKTYDEKWRVDTIYTKEPETIAWIKDFDPNCVFWDVGANIGIYSVFCATVHPHSKVYAFEPLRSNYLRLWENIWLNNLVNVEANYKCLGNWNGVCVFDAPKTHPGSSGGQAKTGFVKNKEYMIPILKGDSVFLESPNYVKIDVDGIEMEIIKGMKQVLKTITLKSLLIEINNETIISFLERFGFVPDSKYNKLKDRPSDKNVIFKKCHMKG